MTQVVFLDWGGTLVRSLRDPYPVYAAVLAERGSPVDRSAFEAAWGRLPKETAATARPYLGRTDAYWRRWDRRALRELGIPDPDGAIGDALRDAFTDPRWHAPYPEVEATLERLTARGDALHIVSNNTEDLPIVLRRIGWERYFRTVTFSQEVGEEKPGPAIFRLALSRAGVPAGEVVHVGDSLSADVEGARNAGLRPVWLDRDGRSEGSNVPTIRDLRGLVPLLERSVQGSHRPGTAAVAPAGSSPGR